MKSTLIASLATLGVVDLAKLDGFARLAVYVAPFVVGAVQAYRKRSSRKRTAKARSTPRKVQRGAADPAAAL